MPVKAARPLSQSPTHNPPSAIVIAIAANIAVAAIERTAFAARFSRQAGVYSIPTPSRGHVPKVARHPQSAQASAHGLHPVP